MKTDPARMAQGIMTGIGFLEVGVIYKEDATELIYCSVGNWTLVTRI